MEEIAIFEQLFTTMKEHLAEISLHYSTATAEERLNLDDQLTMLKSMSDQYMEHWLEFEEKLSEFYAHGIEAPDSSLNELDNAENKELLEDDFKKAQGFYKLYMFEHAVKELEKLIKQQPDDLLTRTYLAMGYLRLGQYGDAYPHFQMILPLTENNQLKAISYNAMGCIQLRKSNIQKALEYFQLAYHSDPACLLEPVGHIGMKNLSQQRLP